MKEMKLKTVADLMFAQSGEEVDIESIVTIPCEDTDPDRCEVYAACTDNYTCLVHLYMDGRVHVYTHER